MMDAYTHLDMSVQDPIADLELRMDAARVDRALVVETWGRDNRSCLETLIAYPSPRFRVALCFRPEEGGLKHEVLNSEIVGALRIRTADIQELGLLSDWLERAGKWLLPHAESGIEELTKELLLLAVHHPELHIFLPHLGWPRHNQQDDGHWSESVSRLSSLPNVIVGISAIAHFSCESFPHKDIEPFAVHLLKAFGSELLCSGSDYPLFEKDRYGDYMKLAAGWIHSHGERSSLLETSLFRSLTNS